MLPHLIDEARGVCQQEEANTKRELVIHLRCGDFLSHNSWLRPFDKKLHMAPCSLLDKILMDPRSGSFDRIRAITEPDRKHPCLKDFVAKGVEVQSKSLAADACAFMHAKHIVYFGKSTFSEAFSLFNPNPVTVYDPEESTHACKKHGADTECQRGQAIKYCVPKLEHPRNNKEKVDYVVHFPKESIWRDGLQCFD